MDKRMISRIGQIRIYLGKCLRLFVTERHWKYFVSSLLIIIIISMVTSDQLFRKYADTKNGVFAIICACIWIGLFNSIQSICRERAIIKREHRTGLHISSYIIAHVIYEAILCVGEALIVTLAVSIKNTLHMPPSGVILPLGLDLFITFFLVTFSADMIAILISSVVRTENMAMTIMPFVLIIQLVMSGSVFPLEGVSQAISKFTISKWGLDGICSIACTFEKLANQVSWTNDTCAASAGHLLYVWLMLLSFSAVYIILSILVLKQVDHDER